MPERIRNLENWAANVSLRTQARATGLSTVGSSGVGTASGSTASAGTVSASQFVRTQPNATSDNTVTTYATGVNHLTFLQAAVGVTTVTAQLGSGTASTAGAGFTLNLLDSADSLDPGGNAFALKDLFSTTTPLLVKGDGSLTVGPSTLTTTDAGTANEPTMLTLQHRSSGTPAASFGSLLAFRADNAANTVTDQLTLAAGWSAATAGSENSLIIFKIRRAGVNTEVMRLNAVGNGTLQASADFKHFGTALGFYNTTPIAQLAAYTPLGVATRVFPADPSVAYTGLATGLGATPYAAVADLNTLRAVVSSLEGVLRQVVQDLGKTTGHGLNAT